MSPILRHDLLGLFALDSCLAGDRQMFEGRHR